MTRETKIGLVVGLAFIIVIGVLVSDHLSSVTRPPKAEFADGRGGGATVSPGVVRQGTDRTIALVDPEVGRLQSPRPIPGPVGPRVGATNNGGLTPIGPDARRDTPPVNPNDIDIRPIRGTDNTGPRADLLPPERPIGDEAPLAAGLARYKAVAGDTVSRLSLKFMGANTNANREKLISLNASLRANPNKVVVGDEYIVPNPSRAIVRAPERTPLIPLVGGAERTDLRGNTPAPREAVATTSYTTRPGDTLWKIARDQCGSQSKQTVDQIKTLNQEVLKGKELLHPNLKLKLPGRSVAIR